MMLSEFGFRSEKSNHDLHKCHLSLQGESVENFMTLLDLQILVKGCASTSYEARRSTQKEFASPFAILNCR